MCQRRGPSGCLSLGFRKPGSHCKIPATVSHTLEGGTAPHPHGPAPHRTSGCFPGQRIPFQVCSRPCPAPESCRTRVLCSLGPWSLLWPLAVRADMQWSPSQPHAAGPDIAQRIPAPCHFRLHSLYPLHSTLPAPHWSILTDAVYSSPHYLWSVLIIQ